MKSKVQKLVNLKNYKWMNTREKIINFLVKRMNSFYTHCVMSWEWYDEAKYIEQILEAMSCIKYYWKNIPN